MRVSPLRVPDLQDKDRVAASALVRNQRRDGTRMYGLPLSQSGKERLRTSRTKGSASPMRQINIRFECDPSLDSIEILIQAPEQDEAVTALMEQISGRPQDTITVFDGKGGIRTIPTDEIVLASTDGKLVNLITEDGIWHVRRTLQSLEDALDGRRFIRISRYELVNLGKVRRYDFTVAGTLRLELAGGMETWAARRCIPEIRRRLQGRRDER